MSASQAIKHARAVRQRLRHPRNAVADHGIDLKRKPVLDRGRTRTASARRRRAAARHRHAVAGVCAELSGRADGAAGAQRPDHSARGVRALRRQPDRSVVEPPHPGAGAAAPGRGVALPQADAPIRCRRSAITSATATTPPCCTPRGGSTSCVRPTRRCRRGSMPSSRRYRPRRRVSAPQRILGAEE